MNRKDGFVRDACLLRRGPKGSIGSEPHQPSMTGVHQGKKCRLSVGV